MDLASIEPILIVPPAADRVQAVVASLRIRAASPDVFEDDGALEVERWQPARDGRGFEQAPEGARPLSGAREFACM